MNFQQLRYVRTAIQHNLNLTEVANRLSTSQSGVSKQIKELEAELKVDIFVRRGKRLTGLTKAGENAAQLIDKLLHQADNLKRLSEQFVQEDKGRLVVATTHNQANYVLPPVLLRFSERFPEVEIELRQGTPRYVVDLVLRGEADIGVATEAVDDYPELQTYPCFSWEHVVIVPPDHPLARAEHVSLADTARYPIITYNPEFSGRSQINEAYERAGIEPDIRLTAMDADVIKTYVRLGMGVGIVSQMAVSSGPGDSLMVLPGSNRFFQPSVTKIATLKGSLLRNYAYQLMEMLAPHLDAAVLAGVKRRPSQERAAPLLSFADRADLQAQRLSA
ncbi:MULTISPECIES: LysR substrate-binding domain-containing protein [Sphingobium]|uniref:LysR substrate-binding domain-containing protein n=1 Tax=Sphingobium tyrosinilyticum TaxID=2715436 RepID=A0ABV9EZ42_9SPHN|nr:LysR substrate-binding domain-containing protein [Sphingobium sp. EP60837]ANI79916.1 HTH-type transcriptional regulator cbl [Sphingobium sp. EP60837]